MRTRIKFTTEDLIFIKSNLDNGISIKQISLMMNLKYNTVYNLIQKNNLKSSHNYEIAHDDLSYILKLRSLKVPLKQISKSMDIDLLNLKLILAKKNEYCFKKEVKLS